MELGPKALPFGGIIVLFQAHAFEFALYLAKNIFNPIFQPVAVVLESDFALMADCLGGSAKRTIGATDERLESVAAGIVLCSACKYKC